MTIKLRINGIDFSKKLSSYRVTQEVTYDKVITTLGGKEMALGKRNRDVVSFSMLPLTEEEVTHFYDVLSEDRIVVSYTKDGASSTEMRIASNLESVFLLDSIDGKRRYRGGEIVLRSIKTY